MRENHKLEINRLSKKNERLPQFLADTAHPFRLNPWLLELDSGSQTLFFWAPKSLQMVIVAMKLKDAYSLEEKL